METALGPDNLIRGGRYSTDFAVSGATAKYGYQCRSSGRYGS
jgi:hypothetical protein